MTTRNEEFAAMSRKLLANFLGQDALVPSQRLADYAVDGLTPQAVVQTSDPDSICQVLRWASEQQMSVCPRGGGTLMALGNVPRRVDLVLDLSQFNHILDHQPADLTATVQAGITLQALQQELARHGQFVPLEAPLPEQATIGGIVAANASGPSRSTYGLARDWLIGISVVGANGVQTKAGGKVVKNVTGYDLNKLYVGSLGTLGVIVEATFKLSPLPPDSGTLMATFPTVQQGIDGARSLLRQVFAPQGLQVIDGLVAGRSNSETLKGPGVPNGAGAVAFFSGRTRAVRRKLDQAMKLFREDGATEVREVTEDSNAGTLERSPLFRRLNDLGWSRDTAPYLGLKVSVPPSAVGPLVAASRQVSNLITPPGIIADPGFGMVRLFWWPDDPDVPNQEASYVIAAINQFRSLARAHHGSVVVEHCPLAVKQKIDVWGDEPQGIEIMRRIKQRFDPLGILNPGRFIGRL